jgi:hypothetical protein
MRLMPGRLAVVTPEHADSVKLTQVQEIAFLRVRSLHRLGTSSLWLTLLSPMFINLLLPRRHALAAGKLLLRRVAAPAAQESDSIGC